MFLVACSIFDNCGQSEPRHSCVWEFYALYLKCKLPLGRNLMFTPFQQAWAGICPWQREKKKGTPQLSLIQHSVPFSLCPSLQVCFCRTIFKTDNNYNEASANDWCAERGFPYCCRLSWCPDTYRTGTFGARALNHKISEAEHPSK